MKILLHTILVLFSSLLISTTSFSQNTLDISGALGQSSRLSENGTLGNRVSSFEEAGLSYRLGAAYAIQISPKTYISLGTNYASLATKIIFEPGDLRWGTQWNGTTFDPTLPSGETIPKTTAINRSHFIEAPITIRQYLKDNNRFYIHVGLVPAFHLSHVSVLKQEGEKRDTEKDTFTDFRDFQLAAKIGVGMDWPLSEKLKLFTQLNGQIHLLEEVKNSGLRWWDVSLQAGVRLGI